ncbi:MAG: phosphatase PAP2 family protein [Haloarculaceae archaeon]
MILSIPLGLLKQIVLVVGALLLFFSLTIIGIGRLGRLRRNLVNRLEEVYPYILLLAIVLALNSFVRTRGEILSWLLDWQVTGFIYSIEGDLVANLQAYLTGRFLTLPGITQLTASIQEYTGVVPADQVIAFFSFVYVYGYVFLMVFPFVAYLAKDRMGSFRTLMLAYAFNYTIGVLCYVLFISYGPRNLLYPEVQSLMYEWWPRSQILTGEINSNTNVFPSLHSSIAATVALLAYRTRDTYPAWLYISTPIALGVLVATMFLGIHWGVDVVAGVGLAVISIALADKVTDENGESAWLNRVAERTVMALDRRFQLTREWLSNLRSEETDSQSR